MRRYRFSLFVRPLLWAGVSVTSVWASGSAAAQFVEPAGFARIGRPHPVVPCPVPASPPLSPIPTPSPALPSPATPGSPTAPASPTPSDPLQVPPEQPAQQPDPAFDLSSDSTLALGGGDVALSPNMIGDFQGGGCGGLNFSGLLRVTLEHPTFGCSRLNIAENNSPLPRDRVYFRYNHFDQETNTDVFSDTPRGARSSIDLDRYTFGLEKTFFDRRLSTELRMPVNRQFVNTIDAQDTNGNTNLPLESRNTVIGNLGLTTKLLLMRSEKLNISGGLGVNIPTERSVKINVRIRNNQFVLRDPTPTDPTTLTAPVIAGISGQVKNETVNLSPYFAALYTPTDRFFAQGFVQVDVPVNQSNANIYGFTFVDVPGLGPVYNNIPFESGFLKQQILMRFNAGTGYWIYKNPDARWVTGFAPTIEAHYSTTISDASTLDLPLQFFPGSSADLVVGNLGNRIDIFNLTLGGTALLGQRGMLATGFVIPVSEIKPFNYEFTVQLNWFFGNTSGRSSRVSSF